MCEHGPFVLKAHTVAVMVSNGHFGHHLAHAGRNFEISIFTSVLGPTTSLWVQILPMYNLFGVR